MDREKDIERDDTAAQGSSSSVQDCQRQASRQRTWKRVAGIRISKPDDGIPMGETVMDWGYNHVGMERDLSEPAASCHQASTTHGSLESKNLTTTRPCLSELTPPFKGTGSDASPPFGLHRRDERSSSELNLHPKSRWSVDKLSGPSSRQQPNCAVTIMTLGTEDQSRLDVGSKTLESRFKTLHWLTVTRGASLRIGWLPVPGETPISRDAHCKLPNFRPDRRRLVLILLGLIYGQGGGSGSRAWPPNRKRFGKGQAAAPENRELRLPHPRRRKET